LVRELFHLRVLCTVVHAEGHIEAGSPPITFCALVLTRFAHHALFPINTGKEEWFVDFYKGARKHEKGAVPPGGATAVVTIQRHMRGVLGRKKARKVFMQVYVKMFDSYANAAFYQNTRTGEASWTRPLMTRHLYHKSNW
jgi:hypothetical protein